MKGKLLFVAGLGVGYVLGARAGRKRYDQIAAAARKVWETPGVQRQVHQAQDFAAEKVGDIPGALIDAGKKAVASVVSARKDASASSDSGSEPETSTTVVKASTAKRTSTKKPSGSAKDGA